MPILIAAGLLVASAILGATGRLVPAGACAGGFVLFILLFFAALGITEKLKLKSAENIVGKEGTRKVRAVVKSAELYSRRTALESRNSLAGLNGVTVSALYKTVLRAGGKDYTALLKTLYRAGDELEVYINGNTVYAEEQDKIQNTPQEKIK